ncbi:MAG: PIN domain-containing protein [Gaiella sp.]
MKAFIDTNVLIRHLTQDPPSQGAAATSFLAAAHELLLTDLVLAETVYVLESFSKVSRREVAALARSVVAFPSITTDDEPLLLRAIEVYETERVDFAEAYLVACAERTGVTTIASFDRSIDRMRTITRIDPRTTHE